jgi:hypothetical protein
MVGTIGRRMGKTCKGLFNITRHRDIDRPGVVIPVESEAGVVFAVPVSCY